MAWLLPSTFPPRVDRQVPIVGRTRENVGVEDSGNPMERCVAAGRGMFVAGRGAVLLGFLLD
jgi:hypothetical protein